MASEIKSKMAEERDKNKSCFHFVSKTRRARNHIYMLRVAGQETTDPATIKDAIRDHFHSFFTSEETVIPKLRCSNLMKISMEERTSLEECFYENEIWDVIKNCDENKSPGPDGFNFNFFKHFWSVIKEDVCKFFEEFHANGKLVRILNASFISLIPKIPYPQEVADFRPISFIGNVYKLVSKVLGTRLQKILPRVITENQFSFTPGRQINDCILLATEVVDFLNKS